MERFSGGIFSYVFGGIVFPGIVWVVRTLLSVQYGWSAVWLLAIQIILTILLAFLAFLMNWKMGATFVGVSMIDILWRMVLLH